MSTIPTPRPSRAPTVPPTPQSGTAPGNSISESIRLDVTAVKELFEAMKGTLGALGATFDMLGEQTAHAYALGPAIETTHQLHTIQKELEAQDQRQEERIQNVKILLRDVLKNQIAEHLTARVCEMIQEHIQEQIKSRVAEQLQIQIPNSLREQVKNHKHQILVLQRRLHNSEARRYNSILRSQMTEPLRPLLRPNGEKSDLFPKDLSTIFGLSATAARQLVQEFELGDDRSPADANSREKDLNKFLAHIGVSHSASNACERYYDHVAIAYEILSA